MICPKCGGRWKVTKEYTSNKLVFSLKWPFISIKSAKFSKRHACSKCGYLDTRKTWVGDEYVGPPELETSEDIEKIRIKKIFFDDHLMPCCMSDKGFYEGPSGGMCTNIKCVHCGTEWNVSPVGYIERI